jgi:hypothetical protein
MSTWGPIKVVSGDSSGLTTSVTAYTSADQLGTEITLAALAGANNGFGVITGISVVDDGDVLGSFDLFLFSDSTTPAADNAAAAWSDADAVKIVPGFPINMPTPIDVGGARISAVSGLWIPFQSGSGHDDLFCDLVTRSGHTFFVAADDIHVRVSVIQQT